MKKRTWAVLTVTVLSMMVTTAIPASAQQSQTQFYSPQSGANNVILFIGDGMGQVHRDAIRLTTQGLTGELAMDLPIQGSVRTRSANHFITDSAASATAMATGEKTNNGYVGMSPQSRPLTTILEKAKSEGKATGIVTTSEVTDASTAAFAAHVQSRSNHSEIARQFIEESQPDVILGGGENYWYPRGEEGAFPDTRRSRSKGTRGNLVAKAQQRGYQYVTSEEELQNANGTKILGLFANDTMFTAAEEGRGDKYDPLVPLPEMTTKAINTLSKNKNGFFLVVEEEGIDEMSHYNNAEMMLQAGEQLDEAVAKAKLYAEQAGDTLVIVVGDHETGGLEILLGDGHRRQDGPFPIKGTHDEFMLDWRTRNHTAVNVPLTAMGPGDYYFQGTYENTEIYQGIKSAMSLW